MTNPIIAGNLFAPKSARSLQPVLSAHIKLACPEEPKNKISLEVSLFNPLTKWLRLTATFIMEQPIC